MARSASTVFAAGLAWLHGRAEPTASKKRGRNRSTPMDDVRAYLMSREKPALVELLIQQAAENERLGRHLLLQAAKRRTKAIDVDSYRRAIDDVPDTEGFVEYGAAYDYARRIGMSSIPSVSSYGRHKAKRNFVKLLDHATWA